MTQSPRFALEPDRPGGPCNRSSGDLWVGEQAARSHLTWKLTWEGPSPQNPRHPRFTQGRPLPRGAAMPETFILIPGRTSRQGCGISEGKFSRTTRKRPRPAGLASRHGVAGVIAGRPGSTSQRDRTDRSGRAPARGDELPPGLLFIAYGDLSSRLLGADTHGSGIPTSKGIGRRAGEDRPLKWRRGPWPAGVPRAMSTVSLSSRKRSTA